MRYDSKFDDPPVRRLIAPVAILKTNQDGSKEPLERDGGPGDAQRVPLGVDDRVGSGRDLAEHDHEEARDHRGAGRGLIGGQELDEDRGRDTRGRDVRHVVADEGGDQKPVGVRT